MLRRRISRLLTIAIMVVGAPFVSQLPASAADPCPIWATGIYGEYICDYPPEYHVSEYGAEFWFVTGTDRAVWYAIKWPGSSWTNWYSLGGWVQSSVDAWNDGSIVRLKVLGGDRHYCRYFVNGQGWNANWYQC